MTPLVIVQLSALFFLSAFGAASALYVMSAIERRRQNRLTGEERASDTVAFLFDETRLVDASPRARELMKGTSKAPSDLDALLEVVADSYPDLEIALANLPETLTAELDSLDGTGRIELEYRHGLSRVSLFQIDTADNHRTDGTDPVAAMEEELETLRTVANASPFLVWKTGEDNRIGWANSAYIRLARQCDETGSVPVWPPPVIFSDEADPPLPMDEDRRRQILRVPGEVDPRHFEQHSVPMRDGRLYMAVPADRAVRAETALSEFVQTLTKTFAHLTVGLAIFDRQRRLALFNPALAELTTLKPEFLTARPLLKAFLDRLRDKRMIPEPRDYKSWRQQIYELEAAANEGTYVATWPLPNGQTFRVTGRPHPGGGLAFIFEDKSAEMSLTRRYRAELETGQAVLDSFEEAIVVFSPNGGLTLSNSAYARLWGADPSQDVLPTTVVEATRRWSAACAPSPVWGDLREFTATFAERAEWGAELRLHDGRGLMCRAVPLAGGSTLVGFRHVDSERLHLPAPDTVTVGQQDGQSEQEETADASA